MFKKKYIALSVITLILSALSIQAASAHVEFSDPTSVQKPNRHVSVQLDVPHNCTTSTKTTELDIKLPGDYKGFMPIGVMSKGKTVKGWVIKTGVIAGSKVIIAKGPAIDALTNNFSIYFMFTTPSKTGILKVPTVQRCTGGKSISWSQPRPSDGSDPAESATPVPQIEIKG